MGEIKHGRKPTVAQAKLIRKWGLNPENWLIVKNQPEQMVIVHRVSDQTRVIPRE